MPERFLPEFRPQEACEETARDFNRNRKLQSSSSASPGSRTGRDDVE